MTNLLNHAKDVKSILETFMRGKIRMKYFPLDCTIECPHLHTWDMSVDDWTSVCDILKVQVDDCDGDFIRYRCPLDCDERYTNILQNEGEVE